MAIFPSWTGLSLALPSLLDNSACLCRSFFARSIPLASKRRYIISFYGVTKRDPGHMSRERRSGKPEIQQTRAIENQAANNQCSGPGAQPMGKTDCQVIQFIQELNKHFHVCSLAQGVGQILATYWSRVPSDELCPVRPIQAVT